MVAFFLEEGESHPSLSEMVRGRSRGKLLLLWGCPPQEAAAASLCFHPRLCGIRQTQVQNLLGFLWGAHCGSISLDSVAGFTDHVLTMQSCRTPYVSSDELHNVRGSANLVSNSDTDCCTYEEKEANSNNDKTA